MSLVFEDNRHPLLPLPAFLRRVGIYAGAAILLVTISWLIGVLGYRVFEGLSWIDAILNAAMILGRHGSGEYADRRRR